MTEAMAGPRMMEAEMVAALSPMPRPSSLLGKMVSMSLRLTPVQPAAPTPCRGTACRERGEVRGESAEE